MRNEIERYLTPDVPDSAVGRQWILFCTSGLFYGPWTLAKIDKYPDGKIYYQFSLSKNEPVVRTVTEGGWELVNADGITKDSYHLWRRESGLPESPYGTYDWQPDNGCRYRIIITRIESGELSGPGEVGHHRIMVTWLHRSSLGGSSFLMPAMHAEEIGVDYFMEKMGIHDSRRSDAVAVLDLMSRLNIIDQYY